VDEPRVTFADVAPARQWWDAQRRETLVAEEPAFVPCRNYGSISRMPALYRSEW
jgi:hypothetical protein